MKLVALVLVLSSVSCASVGGTQAAGASAATPAPSEQRIALYLGSRSLDQTLWAPVDDQATFGVEYSQERSSDAIGWEIGLMGSTDDSSLFGTDVSGSTGELYGGIRKTFGDETVHPYVGAGLSLIGAQIEVAGGGSEDDQSAAAYLHGGVDFDLGTQFVLGLDFRMLFGSDITLAGVPGDADYSQVALRFAWRF